MFAAWADHKGVDEFAAKDGEYQSLVVATYRAKQQIEAVMAEDARMKAKRMEAELAAQRNP